MLKDETGQTECRSTVYRDEDLVTEEAEDETEGFVLCVGLGGCGHHAGCVQ